MAFSFSWNEDKNQQLKRMRGIGFEDVIAAIDAKGILDDVVHPNPGYPNQRILYVEIEGYAVAVPYVTSETGLFLKTAFPDRKATKRYLGDE